MPRIPRYLMLSCLMAATCVRAQVDEDALGAWYAWFYDRSIGGTPWATQMVIQRRDWDTSGDLLQRLVQGMVSYRPAGHPVRYGFGYYHLRHGAPGPSAEILDEQVLFQQGLVTARWGAKNYFTGRLRLEEHWPDGEPDFRRLRTYLSINRPLNRDALTDGAIYLSLYNEHFLELDNVGFALNRAYAGLGWKMTDHTSWQVGIMRQSTRSYAKNQVVFNLFHHY